MPYYASKYIKALTLRRAGVKRSAIGTMLGISSHRVDSWVAQGERMIAADIQCFSEWSSNPLYPFDRHDRALLYALAVPDQDWLQFLSSEC